LKPTTETTLKCIKRGGTCGQASQSGKDSTITIFLRYKRDHAIKGHTGNVVAELSV